MKRWHRSEVAAHGTVWTVRAAMEQGRLTTEALAASEADGTVELQLVIAGGALHLSVLVAILEELRTELVGRSVPVGLDAYRMKKGLPNAYQAWTDAEEELLLDRWDAGDTVEAIAQRLGRGRGGVRSRLVRLGRIEAGS